MYIILLDFASLFKNAIVLICNIILEKSIPFAIGESIMIQLFKAMTEVRNEILFFMYLQMFIPLLGQQANEFFFKCRFTLITVGTVTLGSVLGYNGIFGCFGNDVEIAYRQPPIVCFPNLFSSPDIKAQHIC